MTPLKNYTVAELTEELKDRHGVTTVEVYPYADTEVKVNGPATILVVHC